MKKLLFILFSLSLITAFTFKSQAQDQKIGQKGFHNLVKSKDIPQESKLIIDQLESNNFHQKIKEYLSLKIEEETIVYQDMNMRELIRQLDKSMYYQLDGHARTLAREAILNQVDPYLTLAIILHETGCNGRCSKLVSICNNIGAVKGYPGCGDTSFKYYDSIDDSITALIELLRYSYYNYGLNSPESIAYKYSGGSESWANYIYYYIDLIANR